MKPCPLCDTELQDRQKTCHKCGFLFTSEPERKPDAKVPKKKQSTITRPCPLCKEPIRFDAVKCKHCGSGVAAAPTRPCPNCKKLSTNMFGTCSHCNAPLPTLSGAFYKVLAAGLASTFLFLVLPKWMRTDQGSPPPPVVTAPAVDPAVIKKRQEEARWTSQANTIYVCAKLHVTKMLRSPSTAKWPWVSSTDAVMDMQDGTYLVSSYLDAQNGFGATVRTNFGCQVSYNPQTDTCGAVECILE